MDPWQAQIKELMHEVDAANAAKDEMTNASKDREKKYKQQEAEILQLQEDLAASERARKVMQSERDDLQDELASGGAGK